MFAAFSTVLAANLTNCLIASNSLSSRLRPSSSSPSTGPAIEANPRPNCAPRQLSVRYPIGFFAKGQHVGRNYFNYIHDGPTGGLAHRVAEFTVRILDKGAEDAIELYLVCDFQQRDGLLHFLILIEESPSSFSFPGLRPDVFEFQLGRVIGQRI